MRQTVTNMIGTLPPQFFAVTVTTVSVLSIMKIQFSGVLLGGNEQDGIWSFWCVVMLAPFCFVSGC